MKTADMSEGDAPCRHEHPAVRGSALSEDADKRLRAISLLNSGDLALSVQVLQEFHHQATHSKRRGAHPGQALEFIASLGHVPVQEVTREVFREAVAISRRYRVSYRDGAILAAARAAGCDVVYTEDLNAGQDYGGVRVINPFADGVAA